jgi:hypothetical protein
MIKIHFVSGKVKELDQPWDKFPQKLNFGGLRLLKGNKNLLIPLNSNTIEYVEYEEDEIEETIESEPVASDEPVAEPTDEPEVEATVPEPEKETPQEAQDRMLAEMMEKSNCHKNKHEGQDMEIYYQETTVGKGKTAAKRYFPVCSFCGVRERYVKASDLTDEQKENAKVWDK